MKTQNVNIFIVCTLSCFAMNAEAATSEFRTTDGRIYRNATVIRSDVDGLVINYRPEQAGIGIAELHFRNLTDGVRSRFEKEQAQAAAQWRAQIAAADETLARFRALAEINRALAGDAVTSHTVSLGPDGRITGFTGSPQPYSHYPRLNSALWPQSPSSQFPQH